MHRLHQTAIAIAISTVFSSISFAAPTPEDNAKKIAENEERITRAEKDRFEGQSNLSEATRNNWNSIERNRQDVGLHTDQIRHNISRLESLEKTLLKEGIDRAAGETILRDVIDGHTKGLGKHNELIADNERKNTKHV